MQNFKLTYFTVGNQITSIHDNYAPVYKSQKIDIHEQYYVRKLQILSNQFNAILQLLQQFKKKNTNAMHQYILIHIVIYQM